MAIVTRPNSYSANTTIEPSQVNADFNTLYSDYNGNITDANISASAGIQASKISGGITATSTTTLTNKTMTKEDNTFTFSGCILSKSAAQSINHATNTELTWNTEQVDSNSYHDNSSNTERITIPATGKYLVQANINFAANSTGIRIAGILKNGSTNAYVPNVRVNAVSGEATIINLSCILDLTAADYLSITVYQTSGGALNVDHSNYTHFSITRLS